MVSSCSAVQVKDKDAPIDVTEPALALVELLARLPLPREAGLDEVRQSHGRERVRELVFDETLKILGDLFLGEVHDARVEVGVHAVRLGLEHLELVRERFDCFEARTQVGRHARFQSCRDGFVEFFELDL